MAGRLAALLRRGVVAAHTPMPTPGPLDTGATFYCGFDPTARSLHAGNLAAIVAMLRLSKEGLRPIALVGGATGRVGDPTGRSNERTGLAEGEVEGNLQGIRENLTRIFKHAGVDTELKVLDNMQWLGEINLVDFLRDVGKHVRVQAMIKRDCVTTRAESAEGLSYAELSYQLLQAYDFLHLFDTHGCTVQLGGSDQWGNITAGCDLVRRLRGKEVHGLTLPLLTTSTGEKMGKSAGNAVWLSADLTSPYALFQYLLNTTDDDVAKYLRLLTLLPDDEVDAAVQQHDAARHERTAQRLLAGQIVTLVHGAAGLAQAQQTTAMLFGDAELTDSQAPALADALNGVPSMTLPLANLASMTAVDLAVASGAASSRNEARTLLRGGGVYINSARASVDSPVSSAALGDRVTVIRRGRKSCFVVRWTA